MSRIRDPKKQAVYFKRHYETHKPYYREKNARRRQEIRDLILSLKEGKACIHCGYSKCVAALDFHHDGDAKKELSIANAVQHMWSKQRIIAEIEKCVILCANCHREEHSRVV